MAAELPSAMHGGCMVLLLTDQAAVTRAMSASGVWSMR